MKYLYWVGAALLVVAGIYVSTRVQLQPQLLPKIKYTQVSIPEDFGKMVLEDLKTEIKESPLLFLGVTPNAIEDIEMWRGFFESNTEPGIKYDLIVVEPQLPYVELIPSNMRVDLKMEQDRFVEGVKSALAQGQRVAVIVPTIYSSQMLPGNPADRIKNEAKLEFTSLSISKFPVTVEQEQSFEPLCNAVEEKDPSGLRNLGCAVRQLARSTYKEKIEMNKYSALMAQASGRDYLILLNRN